MENSNSGGGNYSIVLSVYDGCLSNGDDAAGDFVSVDMGLDTVHAVSCCRVLPWVCVERFWRIMGALDEGTAWDIALRNSCCFACRVMCLGYGAWRDTSSPYNCPWL